MSGLLFNRISLPATKLAHHAAFSTSTMALKPIGAEAATGTVNSAPGQWGWKSLSPKTRQYIVAGLAIGAVVDSYVVYNYFPAMIGLGGKSKN